MTSRRARVRLVALVWACGVVGLLGTVSAWSAPSPRASYLMHCSGCHAADGAGSSLAGIPDFRNSISAFAADDEGRTYLVHVPGVVSSGLSNQEIADVLNYILANWGGPAKSTINGFEPLEVARRLSQAVGDVVQLRRRIVSRLRANGIVTAQYPWP